MNLLAHKIKVLVNGDDMPELLGNLYPHLEEVVKNEAFTNKIVKMTSTNNYSLKTLTEALFPFVICYGYHSMEAFREDLYTYARSLSFPDKFSYDPIRKPLYDFFMKLTRLVYGYEAQNNVDSNYHKYRVELLPEEEFKNYESATEYSHFIQAYYNLYLYETMRMGMDIYGFNTVDHIIMIHYLAVYVGRQMKNQGFEIDLPKISAASLGHDIGKFASIGDEVKRIPYLHYYYSDQWFKNSRMPSMGHIASNHSVWDLELENLPIESLVLIYCDFRVKNDDKMQMTIFPLENSFEVILNKLDNVDDLKVKRYKRAYGKLLDFQNYMLTVGIDIMDDTTVTCHGYSTPYAIVSDKMITDNLKFYAIKNNIHIMYLLRSEASLTNLLEFARTERSSIRLREYIGVFKEYSTHLSQKQKKLMINFLFDTITHSEEDIRIEVAELMGALIASYDEDFRKELPKDVVLPKSEFDSLGLFEMYSQRMLDSSAKLIPLHKKWLGMSFPYFFKSISKHLDPSRRVLFEEKVGDLVQQFGADAQVATYLLIGLYRVTLTNPQSMDEVLRFALDNMESPEYDTRSMSLMVLLRYHLHLKGQPEYLQRVRNYLEKYILEKPVISLRYIHRDIAETFGFHDLLVQIEQSIANTGEYLSQIYLSNLKTATSFIQKIININILTRYAENNLDTDGAYTTMHFCNILKVSETGMVRGKAGNSIARLFPQLTIEQKNDVAVELLRSLEIEDYKFAKFIPEYLGELLLFLPPKELDEIIDDFESKIKTLNSSINLLILNTIGRTVSLYSKYKDNYPHDEGQDNRLFRMISLLVFSMAHFNTKISAEALDVISKNIFSAISISEGTKDRIYTKIAKKMLNHLPTTAINIDSLSIGASMNNIYRYISTYELNHGEIVFHSPKKVAFFPGTFDPFTLSHKSIAKTIMDKGYEVYLAIDEFSWSKRTQPHMIRRTIAKISVADEFDIFIYPSSMPVNLANDSDIQTLIDNFPGRSVSMSIGKDVLLNASAYKEHRLVSTLPHIIFDRPDEVAKPVSQEEIPYKQLLQNSYILLDLDDSYKHISSTLIREGIDEGKDISNMLDPLSERYILDKGLYKKEPLFKSSLETTKRKIEVLKHPEEKYAKQIKALYPQVNYEALQKFLGDENARLIRMIDTETNHILGFSIFKWMPTTSIYSSFADKTVSEKIRSVYVGRMVHLAGILGEDSVIPLLLTETLTYSVEKDYTFMVTSNPFVIDTNHTLIKLLKQSGFEAISEKENIYYVNMSNPCTLLLDLESHIKMPFISRPRVQEAVALTRSRLKDAIAGLFPASLIISFDNIMFNEKLIDKICEENQVPNVPVNPRKLGSKMCVPFGHVLSKLVVPNTVTKSLHTEKTFERDMSSFAIRAYPNYLSLDRQIRTIKSFQRDVILVDDILNKGYRINAIDGILNDVQVHVSKVIVGILTSRGKELMEIQNRQVDSAYFIPKLNVWFNESLLYPFVSGDGIDKSELLGSSIPSINLILPFTSPHFIKDATKESIYNLSLTCLENSKLLLSVLEDEYEQIFGRKLTISSLNEVMVYPRIVDYGNHLTYTKNSYPSAYVANDIEKLKRLKRTILR